MKKNILSVIALAAAAAALALAGFTLYSLEDCQSRINALTTQNLELQAKISALSSQTDALELGATKLSAESWADSTGADVTVTLRPAGYQEGDAAALRVLLGSEIVAEAQCQWDGTLLTATAAVPAGNGYSYVVCLGDSAYTLASPDDPAYPELVNLSDALRAYCNMVLGEWDVTDDVLTLATCYVHVQTPRISLSEAPDCAEVRVLLKNGGTILDFQVLSLEHGEGEGSYEGQFSGLTLQMPQLTEGEEVDLWLETTLSDGQILTTCAGTWYATADGFNMAAG